MKLFPPEGRKRRRQGRKGGRERKRQQSVACETEKHDDVCRD